MFTRILAAGSAALAIAATTTLAPRAEAKYLSHANSVHLQAMQHQVGTSSLTTWAHAFKKGIRAYRWVMVGTDPAAGSATTSVPVYIIPMVFKFPDGTILDPTKPGQKYSYTPVDLTLASPLFKNFSFKAGAVDLGTTQYVDAFQRGNFWSQISAGAPNYHVLLEQPTVLEPLVYKVTSRHAVSVGPHGVKIGTVGENAIDTLALNYLRAHPEITPDSFAIFLTYNVSSPNACGYHSNVGRQTYTVTMFDDNNVCGKVDGDVDTLAHEIAEWVDDPFGNNLTPDKTGSLEVGDPAQNYGFYVANATFTYTLQDLMFHDWFTCALPSSSVNGWFDFMNKFARNGCR